MKKTTLQAFKVYGFFLIQSVMVTIMFAAMNVLYWIIPPLYYYAAQKVGHHSRMSMVVPRLSDYADYLVTWQGYRVVIKSAYSLTRAETQVNCPAPNAGVIVSSDWWDESCVAKNGTQVNKVSVRQNVNDSQSGRQDNNENGRQELSDSQNERQKINGGESGRPENNHRQRNNTITTQSHTNNDTENKQKNNRDTENQKDCTFASVCEIKLLDVCRRRSNRPLVVSFGSITCPIFRTYITEFNHLVAKWSERVNFLVVGIHEGHADDEWRFDNAPHPIPQHRNLRERIDATNVLRTHYDVKCDVAVACMDNRVTDVYGADPMRLVVIGRAREGGGDEFHERKTEGTMATNHGCQGEGRDDDVNQEDTALLLYDSGPGPFQYNVKALDEWLSHTFLDK